MTIQKFITYTSIDLKGKLLIDQYQLNLRICENSGNYLIHKNLIRNNFLRRQGTVSTKTRSEVRGGGRKPWKQKGTGQARAGSTRSPLWKGGGICFGPKPKIRKFKLNKKERKLALQTLLYNKRNDIAVLTGLEDIKINLKTKKFLEICKNCNINLNQKILLIVSKKTLDLKCSTKNLKNIELILASNLNIISLLKVKQVLITSLALNDIQEIYCD